MKGWDSNTIERLKNKGMIIKDFTHQPKNRVIYIPEKAEKYFRKSLNNIPVKEDDIQRQCFAWFADNYPGYIKRIFHIPNGGQRNKIVAYKLKQQGTLSGVWDIFLSVPKKGFSGLFIEMKAGKNRLTDNQASFRDANINDYMFALCYSLEEFISTVKEYLK